MCVWRRLHRTGVATLAGLNLKNHAHYNFWKIRQTCKSSLSFDETPSPFFPFKMLAMHYCSYCFRDWCFVVCFFSPMNLQNFHSIEWNLLDSTQSKLLSVLTIMPGICFMNQCLHSYLAFSSLKWSEYVTRKNISTESHMIFSLQDADEYAGFQSDFSLRWTCRTYFLTLFFKEHESKPAEINGNLLIKLKRLWIRLPAMFLGTATFTSNVWKPSWVYPHH